MYKNIILLSVLVLFLAYQNALGLTCHVTQNVNSTRIESCTTSKAKNATNYLAKTFFQNVNSTESKGFQCLEVKLARSNNASISVQLQYCVFNNTDYCKIGLDRQFVKKGGCKLCTRDNCNFIRNGNGNGNNPAGNIIENYSLITITALFALVAKFLNH